MTGWQNATCWASGLRFVYYLTCQANALMTYSMQEMFDFDGKNKKNLLKPLWP